MKSKIFIFIYCLLFSISTILTICYGKLLYLLLAIYCLCFLLYFIFLKIRNKEKTRNFIISIICGLILTPAFSIVSGFSSYRPNHSYYFYKKSLIKENDLFADASLFDLTLSNFSLFMEGQRGQVIALSYTAPNTKEVESYYSKNSIAAGTAIEPTVYDERKYYFSLSKYLKGEDEDYKIYYTYLEGEHQCGVAVNSKEKIVTFFDT